MTVLLWLAAWLGLSALYYGLMHARGETDNPRMIRAIVEHGAKLAHLPKAERERIAHRGALLADLVTAAAAGGTITLACLAAWALL